MFKFIVVVLLCIIAFNACSAMGVSIATINVPLGHRGYIWYSVNGWSDIIHVPFNLPVHYWSW